MTDVSIIIVSYNTAELTCSAIQSVCRETKRVSFRLIVVDNASTDGSREAIEEQSSDLQLIRLNENIGFAAANNLAAEHADGRYILLLNPDTVVLDSAVDRLVKFADAHPDHGIYGGATLFGDLSRNPSAGWNMASAWSLLCTAVGLSSLFRSSRLFSPESLSWWDWSGPREVDIVTGCFLLIRTELWRRLGGFDLQFYMYGEDADLCLRAKKAGVRPILVPEAEIIHYGGASDHVRSDKMTRLLRAKVQLFRKHWSPAGAAYAVSMLKMWSLSRTIAYGPIVRLKPTARAAYEAWRETWKNRMEWAEVRR
jgi:hypothetical protein